MLAEQEIWATFRAGDPDSLLKIYDLVYDPLYSYGLRICRDKTLTEDYIQDIFMELWEKRTKLPEVRSVRAYLMKILKRKHLKNFHDAAFAQARMEVEPVFSLLDGSTEDEIIAREEDSSRSATVKQAIQKLTFRQREVIYLKFFQDLSYTEIAEVTGLTQRRIYNIVHESVTVLRTKLFSFSRYVAILAVSILFC